MRGFIITILSVSLIAILVLLAMSLHTTQVSTERALAEPLPLIYGAFLFDTVAYEFNTLVGPKITFEQRNTSVTIFFNEIIQEYNYSNEITTYSNFLSSEVADRTASNITANFTNLTSGAIRIFLLGDYVYLNNHTATQLVFTREDGTGATKYEINFSVTAIRKSITHMEFNDSGTLNVTIQYTDLNGTGFETGTVAPDQLNTFMVDYVEGSRMIIDIGSYEGNSGSLKMQTTGIRAETDWGVLLPPLNSTNAIGYEYDASLRYAKGPARLERRIGK